MKTSFEPNDPLLQSLIEEANALPQAAAASWSLAGVLVAQRAPD